ncbi:putative tetratricopeptide-like helical domain superfamily [Helianthus annuus]|nr:putative tetratricopeptide-like helical domain superfamily [Helianthus annuus]KAJ0555015.1 putative tetratricopeptide-like helical domain superfamily [Helianthus annuus]KAJ0720583.1 putative tetratricopeptide-like helical domain superfamily [Helianthus annuus]KAJ0723777.1 putative tetratricopeptide-like helical domain superfamily [Helianthus annuus]
MSSSAAAAAWSLWFSSSSSLDNARHRILRSPRFQVRCAVAEPMKKKKVWKQGEYPGDVSSFDRNQRRTPIKNIKKKLDRKSNLNPWVNTVTQALSEAIDTKHWLTALEIFKMLKEQPFYQPKEGSYMKLIVLVGRCGQPQHARNLFNSMIEEGLEPTAQIYTALLAAYCRSNLIDEAFKVLEQMKKLPLCQPDVYTFSILIKACVETMERWYEKFRNFGIEPETRTFNILIGAYGKKKMYDKMSTVMEYMRKLSFPWTTSTYNNVIEAFSDVGDAKNMEYTFDQMRAEGMRADTKTLCCLIRGYANAGLFHKVISMVELAGKLGIPENTSFHNAVLYACAKADDLMEMERVYRRMKDKQQCRADATTFAIMIEAYKKEGMNDKVFDLEQEQEQETILKLT